MVTLDVYKRQIEYICNPDKTDQNLYISSFACSPETAVLDFKYTLDHTHDCRDPHNTNKAFHLIQAFSPGEVSYEEAHQIGKELADRLLEGKYSYVLTTHKMCIRDRGQSVTLESGIRLVVDRLDKNRIELVHIWLPEKKTETEEQP